MKWRSLSIIVLLLPTELHKYIRLVMTQISARTIVSQADRICQCDMFHDIDVVERIIENDMGIEVKKLHFPMVVCLNQDCDLNSDDRDKQKEGVNNNCRLLHLIVAPVFNFDSFMTGSHWGDLFDPGKKFKKDGTEIGKIKNNDDPRYHYLHFDTDSGLPDMIIDFKHFFTVSTDYLYQNIGKRVRAIDELYREKISQRFAYYISRIGLPD